MEDADLKAGYLVELIYRDSGRGAYARCLLSDGNLVSNNIGGPPSAR
jgi:hypothetical protein